MMTLSVLPRGAEIFAYSFASYRGVFRILLGFEWRGSFLVFDLDEVLDLRGDILQRSFSHALFQQQKKKERGN